MEVLKYIVNNGQSPYQYLWSNDSTTATITNLPAGTYTVTATDANGCTITGSGTVTEPSILELDLSFTSETSAGAADGTATASVNGGTGNYTYVWTTSQTSAMITNLPAGDYCVTVTDENVL